MSELQPRHPVDSPACGPERGAEIAALDASMTPPGPGLPIDEWLSLKDRALASAAEGITIADARLPQRPIIYANAGFERLTGYRTDEILGRNCRFLQGPESDPRTIEQIRVALHADRLCRVEILNYKKDGEPFWNRLSITPVRGMDGQVTHYIGVQSDITLQKRAAVELQRAKEQLESANLRMQQDLEKAAGIQRALLPERLPEFGGVRFAWAFRPCQELAGDTLNVVRLDEHRLGLYVLDVSGHGVPAALLSVALTHWLTPTPGRSFLFRRRTAAGGVGYEVASPVEVVERLNRKFPMEARSPQYFTMLYGVLDTRSLELRYVTAGNPPPVHVPRDSRAMALEARGFPVGMVTDPGYSEHVLRLEPGDRLYWYTDGLTEAADGDGRELGVEGLVTELEGARGLPLSESVAAAVAGAERWTGSESFDDDVSVLALET